MKDIIAEYYNWHDELPNDQKDRFDFIVNLALVHCNEPMGSIICKYAFREIFHLDCFKDYDIFWRDELYNATKSLTDLQIVDADFIRIAYEIKDQIIRMKEAISKDKEDEFFDNEARFQSQLYYVLYICNLMDKYLTTDIDTNSDLELFDIGKLKQFDIIIQLMALIDHIVNLFYFKETGLHESIIRPREETTFESLFRDKENAQKVKEILELKGYTENGEWKGISGKLSELSCAYFVLRERFILKPGQVAPQVKTFYQKFKLPDDYTTKKTMETPIYNNDREKFERLFSHLIQI